ncbi:hypothetical protein AAG747_19895 [Rapidithrix thailandica]|uniref:Outer membrane protein beta-barrel domain-containing protein n=1 Tax=Rapidithrix thailandica TaxID=413964 RepID=A0AAW9S8I0_9BACT
MKTYRYLIAAILLLFTSLAHAQYRDTEEDEFMYKSEFVGGINFNTIGGLIGGVYFKYARALTPKMLHSFSLEIVNVKHPKEERYQNILTGGTFIPGKKNYLYGLRPQYGREFILFKKARERGVQVDFITAIGPTLGVVAPYLIEIEEDMGGGIRRVRVVPNSGNIQNARILGTGSFFESLSKSKIQWGTSLKLAMSFEFGAFKSNVTGVEAGFMLDKYFDEIEIMEFAKNRSVYTSAFLTIYFGVRK